MKSFLILVAVGMWFADRPGWTVVLGVAAVLLYAVQCVVWPFGFCSWCAGEGRWYQNKSGKKKRRKFRPCWWCKGTARRKRILRRVWDVARATQKDAK